MQVKIEANSKLKQSESKLKFKKSKKFDMTEEAKLRMNLVAIQNVDRYAKEILDSSPHVAYYKFVNNEWEKTEIEGK